MFWYIFIDFQSIPYLLGEQRSVIVVLSLFVILKAQSIDPIYSFSFGIVLRNISTCWVIENFPRALSSAVGLSHFFLKTAMLSRVSKPPDSLR